MGPRLTDRANRGFTLIEMLVVMAVTGALAGLLLPAIGHARERARQMACKSNLHQIHHAVYLYSLDNDDWLPPKFDVKKRVLTAKEIAEGKRLHTPGEGVHTVLAPYAVPALFRCPSDSGDAADTTPVFLRCGTSYEVKGHDAKEEKNAAKAAEKRKKSRFSLAETAEIARDLFKPWDSDDPAKVAEKLGKGELGPRKWHDGVYHLVQGDGRVLSLSDKGQEKEVKGDD